MPCCLNPDCESPQNPEGAETCLCCGLPLTRLLRNRYRAIQPIGQGGMGRTYLAVDEDRLNTPCAIKQLTPRSLLHASKPESLKKSIQLFYQEAVRLHELGEHPQIPTLLAYFEQDKHLYLVQQFIRGQNLWQELRQQGAFSEPKIWELLLDLLPVLKFVHDRQVVHRDLKPTNIVRQKQDGKLILIDFGVAKQLTATGMAKVGTKVGTEGYAPMEQLRSGRAYPASDLYSLGVTCIHLLTDVPPDSLFDPLTGHWLWRENLKEKGLAITDRLGQILDKLLKETVSDRYQSADAVLQDINPLPPIVPTVTSRTPSSSSQWVCTQTLTGHTDKIRAVQLNPQRQILASSSADKTIHLWQLTVGNDSRWNATLWQTLAAHSGSIGAIAFSPDGKRLISGSNDNTIKLWQLEDSARLVQTLTHHTDWINAIAFSPVGNLFASGCNDNSIQLWQLSAGQASPLPTLSGHESCVNCLAIRQDGKVLASGSDDRTIKLWHLPTGKLLRSLIRHSSRVNAIAFSPDGQHLASGSDDGTIKLWHLRSGQAIATLTEHADSVFALAFETNSILISGSGDNTLKIWQLETQKAQVTLTGHSWWIRAIAFDPQRRILISGSGDHTLKIWQCD